MTKRFTVGKIEIVSDHLSTRFFITDKKKNKYYDVKHIISEGYEVQYDTWAEAICDLLNNLQEEKEYWEKKYSQIQDKYNQPPEPDKKLQHIEIFGDKSKRFDLK